MNQELFWIRKLKEYLLEHSSDNGNGWSNLYIFNQYNKAAINDYCQSLTTQCGSLTSSATVLIFERGKK